MDYATLLDAEIGDFLARTEAATPPLEPGADMDAQRAAYDVMCRAFHAGYPPGVWAEDRAADGVPVRHYRADRHGEGWPVVLYFHGGGFVVGGLHSHDDICAEICAATGLEVVSVDYRLAPEHCHPAAFDDAMAALAWVQRVLGRRAIVVGDSAGGNLAAAVAHAARGVDGGVAGQVLIYPALGGDPTRGSYVAHAQAPILTLDDILYYERARTGGKAAGRDATLAPLRDSDFSGLPPSVVLAAEADPLADDAPAYAEALRAAGSPALAIVEPGLVHGHLRARHMSARAAAAFGRINRAIGLLAGGEMPDVETLG